MAQKVTPWEVKGKIDYDKLINEFGLKPLKHLPETFQENVSLSPGEERIILINDDLSLTLEDSTNFIGKAFFGGDNKEANIEVKIYPDGIKSITLIENAYQYLEINSGELSIKDITFKVNSEWLTNNSFTENSVALYGWNGDSWNRLNTKFVGETSYVSKSSNSKYYVITAGNTPESHFLAENFVLITMILAAIIISLIIYWAIRKKPINEENEITSAN